MLRYLNNGNKYLKYIQQKLLQICIPLRVNKNNIFEFLFVCVDTNDIKSVTKYSIENQTRNHIYCNHYNTVKNDARCKIERFC